MAKRLSALDQAHELNRRVLENPREKGKIIQDYYAEQVKAGNTEGADLALLIRSMVTARVERRVPIRRILRWATVPIIIVAVATGLIIYLTGGSTDQEDTGATGPHPVFWQHLPAKAQNNTWYDSNNSDTAIVFVHGIFSDSRGCWLYIDPTNHLHDQYWPELIKNDGRLEHPAIFLGGYATSIDSGAYDARQAAGELRDALKREGVIDKPKIIFIAHSTGGIVARFLLVHNQDLFRGKMIGLALYASPSIGSPLANTLSFLSSFYNNKLSAELQRDSPFLAELDKDFRDLLYNPNSDPDNLKIVGAEGVENFFIIHRRFLRDDIKVVPEDSASHYFGPPRYLRGTDHFTTVKPNDQNHPGHELLFSFYQKFKKDFGLMKPTVPTTPPVFTTVYDDTNAAGQPYTDVQVFDKNAKYTQPPRPAGDNGHELAVDLAVAGPVMSVSFRAEGQAAAWTHETAVNINGNTAHWTGWSNSGAGATLIFTIRYKQARQVCVKNCN